MHQQATMHDRRWVVCARKAVGNGFIIKTRASLTCRLSLTFLVERCEFSGIESAYRSYVNRLIKDAHGHWRIDGYRLQGTNDRVVSIEVEAFPLVPRQDLPGR
jgi:hypothetical protein